jgi:hypothetical protein
MKKILLPLEGAHYPGELLEFVCTIHPKTPVQLTAALVTQSDYTSLLAAGELPIYLQEPCFRNWNRIVRHHGRRVERICDDFGIKCKINFDQDNFTLQRLWNESRYADLMLLNSRHFFRQPDAVPSNAWMRDMLHRSECPLLLLPDKTNLPGELILAYDGSANSVFAIKEFASLFPEFCRISTTLVYVNDDPEVSIPEEKSIRELCALHFKKFRTLKLGMKTEGFYNAWVGMMQNPWLITGSLSCSGLSPLFSGNLSAELIHQYRVPVFIARR